MDATCPRCGRDYQHCQYFSSSRTDPDVNVCDRCLALEPLGPPKRGLLRDPGEIVTAATTTILAATLEPATQIARELRRRQSVDPPAAAPSQSWRPPPAVLREMHAELPRRNRFADLDVTDPPWPERRRGCWLDDRLLLLEID